MKEFRKKFVIARVFTRVRTNSSCFLLPRSNWTWIIEKIWDSQQSFCVGLQFLQSKLRWHKFNRSPVVIERANQGKFSSLSSQESLDPSCNDTTHFSRKPCRYWLEKKMRDAWSLACLSNRFLIVWQFLKPVRTNPIYVVRKFQHHHDRRSGHFFGLRALN
jgi:hypothetical protein